MVFAGHSQGPGVSGTGVLDDTWEWRSADGWTELHPTNAPSAPDATAMVYDQTHHVVVLYGGVDTQGGAIPCGVDVGNRSCSADTWTWDGIDWNQLQG